MKNILIALFAMFIFNMLSACASSDADMDGIPNAVDECPNAPEDKDNFQDNDGCPDLDNDKDGVPDKQDKCPFKAEDRDGFEDSDGCVDPDNDKDGLPDKKDKCPDDAEDRDGFEDADGCPDLDNDKDGVADKLDKCPTDPEDMDGFEDADGCPERDNDKDGMPDNVDKCPNEAETFNGRDDDDGCPDVESAPLPEEVSIRMKFRTGTAELDFNDKLSLDERIIKKLKFYPKQVVYIFVYMPKVEMETFEYLELLNARSKAISDYLIEKGIQAEQLRTREVTEEIYEQNAETEKDFNQDKPVLFKSKT